MFAPKIFRFRALAKLDSRYGQGLFISIGAALLLLALGAVLLAFTSSATPDTITITSGPNGSSFQKIAERYRKILAREGVTLRILPSGGSIDNFNRLSNPKFSVDIGFVQGGEVKGGDIDNLVSLGSISYQPLMIFYYGKPKKLLAEFRGLRLDIGPEGSGANALARALLKANGFAPNDGTVYVDANSGDQVRQLLEHKVDAVFIMGESTPTELLRRLLHERNIHLYNFIQADGYTRRINYLNKLELPEGSLDLGRNIPDRDMSLVGPTVELIARTSLHPALIDLLLEAARQVHGNPGLFKKRGEFPAPLEHEFRISPDAVRYYASGKSFLYRMFPFWIANLIARVISVLVPFALLLIPALKFTPAIYRWRVESRIYRWYKALLEIERGASGAAFDAAKRDELLGRLARIDDMIGKIRVPASSGNLFYELRGHIDFVRQRLLSRPLAGESERRAGSRPSHTH